MLYNRLLAEPRGLLQISDILATFGAFMVVMVSTMIVTVMTIWHTVSGEGMSQNEMIGKLIKQADYALLATVLYVLALGLYSLFVDDCLKAGSEWDAGSPTALDKGGRGT